MRIVFTVHIPIAIGRCSAYIRRMKARQGGDAMVRSEKEIVSINGMPSMRRSTSFVCDECECECNPDSCNARDWLYSYNGSQLCWDCFMAEADAEIITD